MRTFDILVLSSIVSSLGIHDPSDSSPLRDARELSISGILSTYIGTQLERSLPC